MRRVVRAGAACALAVLCSFLGGTARAESPEDAFDAAGRAYEQGKWDEAAEGFRALLRYGFADPRLEYNLANAEFKRERLGPAILHYERARRLDPSDPQIRENLALARERLRDLVEDADASGPLAAWHALQERVGVSAQAWFLLAGVWIVAILVAWSGSRPGGFTPGRGWALSVAIAFTLLAALSWRATWTRLAGTPRAVVLAPAVEALAGPAMNNASLFTLHEGTTVEVGGEREGWLQVTLPNGLSGWVPGDAAERI